MFLLVQIMEFQCSEDCNLFINFSIKHFLILAALRSEASSNPEILIQKFLKQEDLNERRFQRQ